MTFDLLAYGPEEGVLLVVDGRELLAYDAESESPRWRCTFERPLLAVLFAAPEAIPAAASGAESPWRTPSAPNTAVVIDDQGAVHGVDLALGQSRGTTGRSGTPRAAATCRPGSSLALDGKVIVWRGGRPEVARARGGAGVASPQARKDRMEAHVSVPLQTLHTDGLEALGAIDDLVQSSSTRTPAWTASFRPPHRMGGQSVGRRVGPGLGADDARRTARDG